MVLIGVDVHAAVFLEVNKPQPVVLFELAKGWLTGERMEPGRDPRVTSTPSIGTNRKMESGRELASASRNSIAATLATSQLTGHNLGHTRQARVLHK